ncbi:MAG: L-threonylcarbamoyladenylate synthase [Thermodesulfobacteriota bacterium]
MQNADRIGEMHQAAQALIQGKVLIYPTETFYALGASVLDHRAVHTVSTIKKRAPQKPLPVIIGSMAQLPRVCREVSSDVAQLARAFWPGPLSIVVPAHDQISPLATDASGFCSVRWSSHPLAQKLCVQAGVPVVATSANLSGGPSVSRPQELHPHLIQAVDRVLDLPPYPQGGLPSTVVRPVGGKQIHIIRFGAVAEHQLRAAGWEVFE